MTDVQKSFGRKSHLQQTQAKLKQVKERYNIDSSDELSDEERDSQREQTEDSNTELSISDLSESGMLVRIKSVHVSQVEHLWHNFLQS